MRHGFAAAIAGLWIAHATAFAGDPPDVGSLLAIPSVAGAPAGGPPDTWLPVAPGQPGLAQREPAAPATEPKAPAAPASGGDGSQGGSGGDGQSGGESGNSSISGNPGASNILTGTGKLGELLGIPKDSGIRLGGIWIGDANWLATGGLEPGNWALDGLTIVDLSVDSEKFCGWKGGLFGMEFLQYTGAAVNAPAGVVQGYNSLDVLPPLIRQELYQLWWRQTFCDNKFIVRIGKSIPSADFANVNRPISIGDASFDIPAVSGLIYTPMFVNSTMIGYIPGYYNSATGITTTFAPTKQFYVTYGFYDGNMSNGEQTGLRGPQFNGYYFHAAEVGYSWQLGCDKKPGKAAAGFWAQTGKLTAVNGTLVNGAQGVYSFASQRLWYRNPGIDNSGISGFCQFGANNTNTAIVRQFFGAGLTAFGLVPCRKKDSMGMGLAWAFNNTDPSAGAFYFPNPTIDSTALRTNELMMQCYYQMNLGKGVFFQPNVSYIPNPGQRPDLPGALAITLRMTVLF